MIKINLLKEEEHNEWDNFVLKNPHGTIFHLVNWMKVVKKTYNHTPVYLIARSNNAICGILPLFYVKGPRFLFGKILASGIFTSFAGLISEDKEAKSALLTEAEKFSKHKNINYAEIKNQVEMKEIPDSWLLKENYCTMFLDISSGSEFIWKNWRDKTRNDVRKAIKSGVTIERGKNFFDDFYNLLLIDMKRLGTPPHSRRFYENILEHYPQNSEIFVAKYSGIVIGAILALGINGVYHSYTSVSLINYRKQKSNELLYWNIIQYAIDNGYKYLDFGRSTWESGTFKFKKHLNGKPIPLYYYYFLNNSKEVPHIHYDNKKFKLLINLWRLLPLKITGWIGPYLIKYVV